MKRDARTLDHATLEEFRLLALRRVKEGEKPSAVVKSIGMNRTSIYRWLKAAAGRGKGERGLGLSAGHGATLQAHAGATGAGISLDQRSRSEAVRIPGCRPGRGGESRFFMPNSGCSPGNTCASSY